jgi:hypothetical protein
VQALFLNHTLQRRENPKTEPRHHNVVHGGGHDAARGHSLVVSGGGGGGGGGVVVDDAPKRAVDRRRSKQEGTDRDYVASYGGNGQRRDRAADKIAIADLR